MNFIGKLRKVFLKLNIKDLRRVLKTLNTFG